MNHISILIVDDDLNKISSIIKTIKEVFSDTLSISQASCVQEAIENLQNKEFHLLLTDLQMPLKYGDTPNAKGGESLIKAIYKKKNHVNVPMYIVALTQFENLKNSFNGIWMIWHYDAALDEWKNNLRDLIHHISLIKSRVLAEKIETIFVEGFTDKKIIEKTLKAFYPEYVNRVYIDAVKFGGGASWVERQLFIWSKSLTIKSGQNDYLKAVGIFDNDIAGNKAVENIRKLIVLDSAESKTFSILKNGYKYSAVLKSIKSKGITFPTTIEDLVAINCMVSAYGKGWLIKREVGNLLINDSILKISNSEVNDEILKKSGFTEDEIFIINNKVNDDFKNEYCNLACDSEKESLINISYQLEDVFEKLKILIE